MALVALLAIVAMRDQPPGVDAKSQRERREPLRDVLIGSWEVMRTPSILTITSGGISLSAGNTILGIWGGPYLNDVHGLGQTERGAVLIFMASSGILGHFLYGQASRVIGSLKTLVLVGTATISVIMGILALLPAPNVITVTVLLAVLGMACGFPTIMLAYSRALVPDYLIGRALTTVNTGVMIAIAAMQLAIGGIIGSVMFTSDVQTTAEGYRIAFGFFAIMAVLTFVIYSRAKDAKPS